MKKIYDTPVAEVLVLKLDTQICTVSTGVGYEKDDVIGGGQNLYDQD